MWNKSNLWSKTFKGNFVFKLNKNSYGAHTGNKESNVAHGYCFIFLFVQGYITTTGSLDISNKKSQRKKTKYILKHKFSFRLSRTDINKRHLTLVKCARLSADRFPQENQTSPHWPHFIFTPAFIPDFNLQRVALGIHEGKPLFEGCVGLIFDNSACFGRSSNIHL